MTANQIAYWRLQEDKRHNLAQEGISGDTLSETKRSNIAKEAETNRSNLAKEMELNRANVTNEMLKAESQAENKRSNLAKERETQRHNIVAESNEGRKLDYMLLESDRDYDIARRKIGIDAANGFVKVGQLIAGIR